jgi:glycosyltransferase involved in cell wall biosynthesis
VRDFSEIVVIDDFSTDDTVAIAQRFNAKVYEIKWQGYAKQKQTGIDRATLPWVLILDSDERVTVDLKKEIAGAVANPEHKGYYIPRKNFFLGRWIKYSGWWPDYTLRLFRKDAGFMEQREVHEKIVVSGAAGHLRHPLEHFTYRTISDYIKKMDNYSTLAARELNGKGTRFSSWQLFVKPPVTFLRMLLFQQGFRDGFHGLILSMLYSFYTFLKYLKLWEIEEKNK